MSAGYWESKAGKDYAETVRRYNKSREPMENMAKEFRDRVDELPEPESSEVSIKGTTRQDLNNYRFARIMLKSIIQRETTETGVYDTNSSGLILLRDALNSKLSQDALDQLYEIVGKLGVISDARKVMNDTCSRDTNPH